MSIKEEIRQAIGSHSLWKSRLVRAIERGASDIHVEDLKRDDLCEFGKWLASPSIPTEMKEKSWYLECVRCHAEFHRVAAEVLMLAHDGQQEKANTAVDVKGTFSVASSRLIGAMLRWEKSL